MQHVVDRTQEVMNSFIKAIEELAILRENLARTEVNAVPVFEINFCCLTQPACEATIQRCVLVFQQIIAEVGTVVEARVPKKPRFSQPLQNAEITEGQRSD